MKSNYSMTVYTMSFCPACSRIKRWLKVNDVSFTEKNIRNDHDSYEEFQKAGFKYTPTIIIKTENETHTIVGADTQKINEILSTETISK